MGDKVTPEMQSAYVSWDAPTPNGKEVKVMHVFGLMRTAFFSGWLARPSISLDEIPDGWFLYGIGECVKPILYRGDTHENTGDGFWCELQYRDGGGRLTKATGATPRDALRNCIAKVQESGE